MDQSTPHHHDPTRTVGPGTAGADPSVTDLVPGDPPVPITVWRTARTDTDTGRAIPARLAARLVAAYTRPGELVVDLTADHSLTTACRTGRRRHHPAWFTASNDLLIGPATAASTPHTDSEAAAPDPGIWCDDDLTDSPPTDGPTPTPPRAATSLVVATWPLHETDPTHRVHLAFLLTGCVDLLRHGGCLMLVVDARPGGAATPHDFGPVVAAATTVGLGYLQHIVAVTADTDGDALVYYLTDEELLALAHDAESGQPAVTHRRVHADLMVFSRVLPPQPAANRGTAARRTGPRTGTPGGNRADEGGRRG